MYMATADRSLCVRRGERKRKNERKTERYKDRETREREKVLQIEKTYKKRDNVN